MWTRPKSSIFIQLGLAFGLSIIAVLINQKAMAIRSIWVEPPADHKQKQNPLLFKTLSFGHLPIVIDWKFIEVLGDSSMTKVKPPDHPVMYFGLDLLSELDPSFYEIYYGGANLLSVVYDDKLGARDLLLKGEAFVSHQLPEYSDKFKDRYWSNAWNLSMLLGYVYLFQLDDMPHAAEAFKRSAELPHAPEFIHRLGERFNHPGGEYEVGLRLLNFMIIKAKNQPIHEKLVGELEKKRLNLFVSHYLYELNRSFREFLKSQKGYRDHESLTAKQMEGYWRNYQRGAKVSRTDPWGGELHLDVSGKVVTNTPHEAVFGLL